MKHLIITSIICLVSIFAQAQTIEKAVVYKGTVDKLPITLFMIPVENECGIEPFYNAMYRYDGKSLWLQLSVSYNKKSEFALVEENGSGDFTGLLLLKKTGNTLSGIWISPDGKKNLKVQLSAVKTSNEERKKYNERFEQLNYENHDC